MSGASDDIRGSSGGHHVSDGHGESDAAHGTLKDYLTGFVLAAILTVIPFWLVMDHVLRSKAVTIGLVLGLGMVQIFVHMKYFLHLNARSEGGWRLMSLLLAVVLVVIVLGASLWVIVTENSMMMNMTILHAHQVSAHRS